MKKMVQKMVSAGLMVTLTLVCLPLGQAWADGGTGFGKHPANHGKADGQLKQGETVWTAGHGAEVQALHQRADVHMQAGEYAEAADAYTQILLLDDQDADAYYGRGDAYNRMDDVDQAFADYSHVIALRPGYNDYVYNYVGWYYGVQEQYEEAIEALTVAIEMNPENYYPYMERGTAFFHTKKYRQAIADYTRSIEISPDYQHGYVNRAHTYFAMELYTLAVRDYDKALALGPGDWDASAYYGRGVCYSRLHRYQAALEDFGRCIAMDDKDMNIFTQRGNVLYALSEYGLALEDYERAAHLEPDNPEIQVTLERLRRRLTLD